MNPEPPRASAALFGDLTEAGTLARARGAALQRTLRAVLPWRTWTDRLLLLLGVALLLAGILFFFAYNWAAMPAWQKLGVVELALVVCAAAAAWKGPAMLAGQVAIFAACALVGVFLAVFGQIYQTGADTFELFLGWAALTLPWVLVARFGALWLLWLLLLNLAAGFSWQQTDLWGALALTEFTDLTVVFAVLNGLALAARELGAARGLAWLREEWLRGVPLTALFAALTIGNCWLIVDKTRSMDGPVPFSPLAPLALLLAAGLTYFFYRWRWPNLYSLAVMALSLSIVLIALCARAILETRQGGGAFLLMAVLVLAVFGGAAWWLRREGRSIAKGKEPAAP